ncbi:GntR family transcriptional regulator [Thalassobaculum fulvum]|uniref:GntR family transcriptional regulator n=1 Tax=Thalassobaculum fulvum TaxID=1633335 RepID=A0A918XVV5_9PROT|nr:PLP-dependent aminotransferase family protein [Thalassobaculum fulvum]GHD60135.1 GntR family transcriptional regulator [Thalassobaculum fulvum]
MSTLSVEPEPGQTLVEAVMAEIRRRVETRALAPGAQVPSLRRLAEALGVSKSTVVEAYDRLAAEGTITARPGSGFYVTRRTRPFSLAPLPKPAERAIDPLWIMRQSLDQHGMDRPGCGWLPTGWLPDAALRRAMRSLARDATADLAEYDSPLGFPPLRRHLADRLDARGIEAGPERILLADSGTQAIDLVCRFLLQPGDTVLLDDPCYFNFQAILRAHRATVVGVPYTPAGPDLEAFARAAAEHRPRLYVTNATLHNPTGTCLPAAAVHRLLKVAEAHDMVIVEDDIFADFETEPAPRLAAFDGLDRVIHVGSFSKTLSAAVRCGFVAARRDWIEGIADLKLAAVFGNGALSAQLVHRMLVDGSYRRHLDGLRGKLARAMGETARRLERAGLTLWAEPRGGMFLWARLPDGLDSAEVARHALERDVVLAPGNVFSPSASAAPYLRFNTAQSAAPRIFEVLKRAMDAAA